MTSGQAAQRLYTIGHSTLESEQFITLLMRHGIRTLVDVRHYPASRRLPHFSQEALAQALAEQGIAYVHLRDLGGRRHQIIAGSGNDGWRVAAFRAYADYAAHSPAYLTALAHMEALARHSGPTAYMCAEHTHLKCHRRIISDYLLARGWDVQHIQSNGKLEPHVYTTHAHIGDGGHVRYPAIQAGHAQPSEDAAQLAMWSA
jgi:uncharacterized protein (DUF488 family)